MTIKLIYFNARGTAEVSRILLAYAGVDYEDKRVERANWPEFKKSLPAGVTAGQLPILERDGKYLSQPNTVARALARQFNLAGKDNWEQARVDMIIEYISTVVRKFVRIKFAKDEAIKKAKTEKFKTEVFPDFVENMEKLLVKNGGEFMVGNALTVADIYIAHIGHSLAKSHGAELKSKAPTVAKLTEKVNNIPSIKKWIETRPQTDH